MKPWQTLALLSGVYFALRLPLLDTPLIPDEIYFTSGFLTALPDIFSQAVNPGGDWPGQWQRQLAVHPPFLSLFYFVWIRIFGDSLLSLRLPSVLCGLAGMYFCYSLSGRLLGEKWAFWCALMLCVCGAHIHYSITAVYAIFELTSFLAAFLALVIYSERKSGAPLLYASLIGGALISYHFIIFMVLSSIFLLLYRRRIPLPYGYVVISTILALLIAGHAYESWAKGIFDSFHHREISGSTLAGWIRGLPDEILRYGREYL